MKYETKQRLQKVADTVKELCIDLAVLEEEGVSVQFNINVPERRVDKFEVRARLEMSEWNTRGVKGEKTQ